MHKAHTGKRNQYNGEAPPCDGCALRRGCASHQLACRQYAEWQSYGAVQSSNRGLPTRDYYLTIYMGASLRRAIVREHRLRQRAIAARRAQGLAA